MDDDRACNRLGLGLFVFVRHVELVSRTAEVCCSLIIGGITDTEEGAGLFVFA